MGPDAGSCPPGLQALRREIARAEHAVTAMRWATKPSVALVLSGLADGSIPLTHQALDGLPQRPALAHLRQTLIAVGALPWRDEEMIRLEAFLHGLLDSQPGTERRRLLHRYLIWHLVRRMRSRNNGKPATRQQALLTRRLARGAVAFLDWLDSAASPWAAASRPTSIAGSPAARPSTGRSRAAHPLGARRPPHHLLPSRRRPVDRPLGDTRRRGPLGHRRQAQDDDALKPEDRLAGLLVSSTPRASRRSAA